MKALEGSHSHGQSKSDFSHLLFPVNPSWEPLSIFLEIVKLRHLFQLRGYHKHFLNTGLVPQGD